MSTSNKYIWNQEHGQNKFGRRRVSYHKLDKNPVHVRMSWVWMFLIYLLGKHVPHLHSWTYNPCHSLSTQIWNTPKCTKMQKIPQILIKNISFSHQSVPEGKFVLAKDLKILLQCWQKIQNQFRNLNDMYVCIMRKTQISGHCRHLKAPSFWNV